MHSIASIEIDRPIDEVLTYTNKKVDEWSLTVVKDEVIEDKDGVGRPSSVSLRKKGVGWIFRVSLRSGSRRLGLRSA